LNAAGARYLLVGGYAVAFHDIITAIDGVSFGEAWPDRAVTTYGEEPVPVVGLRHLVQNKRASGRPQDILDLKILETE
jgi:hypothetical protein